MRVRWRHLTLLLPCLVHARQFPVVQVQDDLAFHKAHGITPNDEAFERDVFYIFNAVHHSLRQMGNTFSPNGFSFTRGWIPPGTNLFHARGDENAPSTPEWLAFDPEMSYAIMAHRCNTFLRTYRATRPLNILYIDGNSASLTSTGTIDSQDLLIYGYVKRRATFFDDYERAANLCAWGSPLGIDGFVRQNTGFELIKCNFDDGLDLVRNLNVTEWRPAYEKLDNITGRRCVDRWPPDEPLPNSTFTSVEGFSLARSHPPRFSPPPEGHPSTAASDDNPPTPLSRGPGNDRRRPKGGPPDRNHTGFANQIMFEWARTATIVYDGLGENRVKLDMGTFITAYGRAGLNITSPNTTDHRLVGLSRDAAKDIKAEIERFFTVPTARTTGIDWRQVTDEIVTRYGGRLQELFAYLSNIDTTSSNATSTIHSARMLVALLLVPHHDLSPHVSKEDNVRACASFLVPSIGLDPADVPTSERKIAQVVQYVHHAICDTLVSVNDDLAIAPNFTDGGDEDDKHLLFKAIDRSRERVSALMNDLRWAMWKSCDRKCDVHEICLITLWPITAFDLTNQDPPRCSNSTIWRRSSWRTSLEYQ